MQVFGCGSADAGTFFAGLCSGSADAGEVFADFWLWRRECGDIFLQRAGMLFAVQREEADDGRR